MKFRKEGIIEYEDGSKEVIGLCDGTYRSECLKLLIKQYQQMENEESFDISTSKEEMKEIVNKRINNMSDFLHLLYKYQENFGVDLLTYLECLVIKE